MPFSLVVETFSFALVFPHSGLDLILGYASLGLDNTCLAFVFLIAFLLSLTRRGNKSNLLPFISLDGLLGRHEHV